MIDRKNAFDWLNGDVVKVAQRLLGCELQLQYPGQPVVRLRIVETEAYHQSDPASHSYKGKTRRTEVMFGRPGHVYVYFTYGMHYCMNIVTGVEGEGAAILIRAAEPLAGWDVLRLNRPGVPDRQLTNGPAKLCQALGIDRRYNGHDLAQPPLLLIQAVPIPTAKIVQTTRIGISQAQDKPWRFYISGNQFVSRS